LYGWEEDNSVVYYFIIISYRHTESSPLTLGKRYDNYYYFMTALLKHTHTHTHTYTSTITDDTRAMYTYKIISNYKICIMRRYNNNNIIIVIGNYLLL